MNDPRAERFGRIAKLVRGLKAFLRGLAQKYPKLLRYGPLRDALQAIEEILADLTKLAEKEHILECDCCIEAREPFRYFGRPYCNRCSREPKIHPVTGIECEKHRARCVVAVKNVKDKPPKK